MTESEREFWTRYRALLIEQEKALAEQRAATIGQRKAIESLLGTADEPHEPSDVLTTRTPYTT